MRLPDRIESVLAIDPEAGAIDFEGSWVSWGELRSVADATRALIVDSGLADGGAVGLLLRNHPAMVGALLGTLLAERCVVTINPHQGDEALARDIATLNVPVVIATDDDWSRGAFSDAVESTGALGLSARIGPRPGVALELGDGTIDSGPFRAPQPGTAVEMLTSGTTGPPKRVPLTYDAFQRTIGAARSHYARGGTKEETPRLRTGVAIVNAPLVHMSGTFRTLLNICDGRPIALLDRFELETWLEAVRHHRPRAVSLVPAALRTVLDADVDPDDLASIRVVTSGTSPLDPETQVAFEDRYGIAVLPSYGATEFAGGVAGWTLALHEEWADRKRGSVGRPQPGREIRIVDEGAADVAAGTSGHIEIRSADGPWVHTTDIGRLDRDGFLWIDGRADDAILRGGFKVFPAEIADALRSHPAVRDAGATGLPDPRLGAVPVAAVELKAGAEVDEDELLDHLRANLARYKVPTRIRIVDSLPRTPSLKVVQPALRALFEPVNETTT